jgi:hypothetical protein
MTDRDKIMCLITELGIPWQQLTTFSLSFAQRTFWFDKEGRIRRIHDAVTKKDTRVDSEGRAVVRGRTK